MQTDIVKKSVEELDESVVFDKPNIFCHFAGGIGEPKVRNRKNVVKYQINKTIPNVRGRIKIFL